MYVFDTSSLRILRNYYPTRFVRLWQSVEDAIASGLVISTKECRLELLGQLHEEWFVKWIRKSTPQLFPASTPAETAFVAKIFTVPHFQSLVGEKQRLQGKPVADPFVIAAAARRQWTVVTQEQLKPNAAKIPNVCKHFGIKCIDLEGFMQENDWTF